MSLKDMPMATIEQQAEKLLLMFIRDSYKGSGLPSRKTILEMYRFVAQDSKLQCLVNNSDHSGIVKHKLFKSNEADK